MSATLTIRSFRSGDGPDLVRAWTAAVPSDPITPGRFRDLFLLDRNFDPDGLLVAVDEGRIVGSAYAVRRRIAVDANDLEADLGWVPFFFVGNDYRRQGVATQLMGQALDWLRRQGCQSALFSSYTPNYLLPGLDAERYPDAVALLDRLGFVHEYETVAMDADLTRYEFPRTMADKITALEAEGYRIGTPSDDDLVDLLPVAHTFNPDWSRAIREAIVQGLDLEKIIVLRGPDGAMLGWAMHGAYEGVLERFGPFGVLPSSRGRGLGEVLLHVTMQRMRAFGLNNAWFLWTEEDSAAGHLYLKTGYVITRRFQVLRAPLT